MNHNTLSAFDRIAPWYEPFMTFFFLKRDRVLLSLIQPQGHERVLDVGAGTGRFGKILAPLCLSITLVDESERMLSRLSSKESHLEVLVGDIFSLHLPSDHYDWIVLSDVLHHLSHFERLFPLLARLLKDQGKILIHEYTPNHWTTRWLGFFERRLFGPLDFKDMDQMKKAIQPWFELEQIENKRGWYIMVAKKKGA